MTTPPFTFKLSPGEAGIAESLAGMAEVVCQITAPGRTIGTGLVVQAVANELLNQVGRTAPPAAYLLAVYNFLRAGLTFREDPPFTELVQHPDQLLQSIATGGRTYCDCDCLATLGASLLIAVGITPVFLVVGKTGDLDAAGRVRLSHVFYGAVFAREGMATATVVPFDPQERIPPGTWPPAGVIGRVEMYEIVRRCSTRAA